MVARRRIDSARTPGWTFKDQLIEIYIVLTYRAEFEIRHELSTRGQAAAVRGIVAHPRHSTRLHVSHLYLHLITEGSCVDTALDRASMRCEFDAK